MIGAAARSIGTDRRVARLATLLALAYGLGHDACAQLPPPSPAALAETAEPLRVVCIADSPEAFLRDEVFVDRVLARLPAALPLAATGDATSRLRALIAPLGRRFIVPVGSGFVVDPERRHVVSNWHVVTACTADRANGRQLGVIEAEGADITVQVAERLPDRNFHDSSGNAVKLVQAVCRDKYETCGADLPRSPDDKPPAEALRRRQLDNVLAYAPDLAVLRLRNPVRSRALALALNQQIDDQMRLVIRAFGPVPVGLTAADAAARLHLVASVSVAAVYTGPQQISYLPLGGLPEDQIHAKLHRLAASVQPGQAGAPVLRGTGVVGVLTALLEPAVRAGKGTDQPAAEVAPVGPAYAVPVTVLAVFLDLLKVPYVTAALELPVRAPVADPLLGPPAAVDRAWWADSQRLALAGALLLAVLAAAAFVLLARRRRPPVAPVLPPPPLQRTIARVNPTLLHAVAMPTAVLDPPPAAPAAEAAIASLHHLRPPPAGVRLHCAAGPLAPSVFSLPMPNGGTTLFVGRDPQSCQLVFPPAIDQVSAVHACFVWDTQLHGLTLRDLSSSGTWVNGQRIAKGRTLTLATGDQVDLGGLDINRFTIDIPGADALAATEFPR